MKSSLLRLAVFAAVSFASSAAAIADTLYVQSGAHGGDCSYNNACGSIQNAIDAASADDTIIIGRGVYKENLMIAPDKSGLSLKAKGLVKLVSAGGDARPVFAPASVPADILIDIFAPNVTVQDMVLIHPASAADKRDIGIFIRPPANNVTIDHLRLIRQRVGDDLEPFAPGSRGVLVFRATGANILNSVIKGNYQDHVHIASSEALVTHNLIKGATRFGVVVIQENADSLSEDNVIIANRIVGSGSDGVQIQGDDALLISNTVLRNQGNGITVCGYDTHCVAPGDAAIAEGTRVIHNRVYRNNNDNIVDGGSNSKVH